MAFTQSTEFEGAEVDIPDALVDFLETDLFPTQVVDTLSDR